MPAVGGAKPTNGKFWLCRGTPGRSCGYMVPRGTAWCDACGNQPPAHVTAVRSAVPAAASPQGGTSGANAPAKRARASPAAAHGPAPPATAATSADDARKRQRKKGSVVDGVALVLGPGTAQDTAATSDAGKLARENAELRRQLAALRTAAPPPAGADSPMEDAGPTDHDDGVGLAAALREAEAALAAVKDLGGSIGSEVRATVQARVDAARLA